MHHFGQPGDVKGPSVDESCLSSTHTKLIVGQGERKEAEGKRGVGFHEDSLAEVKRSIYVSD